MATLSIGHWLMVLMIVLAVIGARKLRDLSADLGCGTRGFKDAMPEGTEKKQP
jgi:sec-independent protein translocase protein TatA